MSKTAVVILNYNGKELLKRFLPSVIQYSGNAEVIVADNGSTDDSIVLLKSDFPTIRIVQNQENLGFCGGYNLALKQITADYYVLLNSDIEVTEGWLTPLIELLESDEQIGAVQPKILSYRERTKFEYAGAAGGFIDWLGFPFCRGRIFHTVEEDQHQYANTIPIFWASGACMATRATSYRELGGLDETFFAHMEEIDYCWRLQSAGKKIMYSHASTVFHVGGATLDKSNPRKTYYNFRNGLQMLIKNLPFIRLILRLPFRIALDWVAAVKFLIDGQPSHSWAVLKAHLHVITRLPALLRKRTRRTNSNYHGIYRRSIVFDYYVLGRRKFSKLKF